MASTTSNSVTSFTSRYGSPVVDQDGARIRAHCRHVATVVTISGQIDAANVEFVTAVTKRFVLSDKPIVLDLTGVSSFAPQAIRFLQTFDDLCQAAGVGWALIASEAVSRRLTRRNDVQLPEAISVAQALHNFDDAILDRRRFLLPLLSKTA